MTDLFKQIVEAVRRTPNKKELDKAIDKILDNA